MICSKFIKGQGNIVFFFSKQKKLPGRKIPLQAEKKIPQIMKFNFVHFSSNNIRKQLFQYKKMQYPSVLQKKV